MKELLTVEEALGVEQARRSKFPAYCITCLFGYSRAEEEKIMRAYVNGYLVKREVTK